MFGLRGFKRLNNPDVKTSRPAARDSMVLVSTEDIYRHSRGAEPVLLLKKGSVVETEDLPKLIKGGAQPHQFQLRHVSAGTPATPPATRPENRLPAFQRTPGIDPSKNPITNPTTLKRQIRSQKRVLVLEPDQKSLKRLIDCLFVCGFNLNTIHPVRVSANLDWAMEKYRPQVLILDYNLPGGRNGLALLEALQPLSPGIEQVVLTLPARTMLSPMEESIVRKLCDEKNIKILSKPVNRFDLDDLLADLT